MAGATVIAPRAPGANGSCSAVDATIGTPGHAAAKPARMPGTGSTPTIRAPVDVSSRVSLPVPAATSATRVPLPMCRCSTSHATASGG